MQKNMIINARNGHVVSSHIRFANTWSKRLFGLLTGKRLKQGQSLWLKPCKSIHTIGMRYPIDVVFLNRHNQVNKLETCMMPYRISLARKGTRSVLELPAGTITLSGLKAGDRLELQ